jgi:sulfide:quinone oxidoreductase
MRGGPIFEFLFGLDTQLRREGRRERIKLTFFNPMPNPGNRLGEKAVARLLGEMKRRDIATHLGHKLVGFEKDKVKTEGGEFAADLIVFMPGLTGNAWFDNTDLPRSPGGLIKADAHCRVEGRECVYVAGDAGSFPGPDWMPKQAHMADLQAEAAAENLLAELKGATPDKTFKVELLCIVDTLDSGMLVKRTPEGAMALPPIGLMHGAKAFFESWYLRRYR